MSFGTTSTAGRAIQYIILDAVLFNVEFDLIQLDSFRSSGSVIRNLIFWTPLMPVKIHSGYFTRLYLYPFRHFEEVQRSAKKVLVCRYSTTRFDAVVFNNDEQKKLHKLWCEAFLFADKTG